MYGELQGQRYEFERSLVFETGEFERPKFDCTLSDVRLDSVLQTRTYTVLTFVTPWTVYPLASPLTNPSTL